MHLMEMQCDLHAFPHCAGGVGKVVESMRSRDEGNKVTGPVNPGLYIACRDGLPGYRFFL
jgi:hypothetical protein